MVNLIDGQREVVSELSKGMLQRITLTRAFFMNQNYFFSMNQLLSLILLI